MKAWMNGTTLTLALFLVLGLAFGLVSCMREPEIAYDLDLLVPQGTVALSMGDGEIDAKSASVPQAFFSTDTPAILFGRSFIEHDLAPSTPPTVILTHGAWERLGGSPEMIGAEIRIDGVPHTVVGIAAKSPKLEEQAEILIPLS